jgi:hypothetical protein
MAKYATDFLRGLPVKQRAESQKLIKQRRAYLERAADGSQYLIVIDPARLDEAIFARPQDGAEPVCIGNRVR